MERYARGFYKTFTCFLRKVERGDEGARQILLLEVFKFCVAVA